MRTKLDCLNSVLRQVKDEYKTRPIPRILTQIQYIEKSIEEELGKVDTNVRTN